MWGRGDGEGGVEALPPSPRHHPCPSPPPHPPIPLAVLAAGPHLCARGAAAAAGGAPLGCHRAPQHLLPLEGAPVWPGDGGRGLQRGAGVQAGRRCWRAGGRMVLLWLQRMAQPSFFPQPTHRLLLPWHSCNSTAPVPPPPVPPPVPPQVLYCLYEDDRERKWRIQAVGVALASPPPQQCDEPPCIP